MTDPLVEHIRKLERSRDSMHRAVDEFYGKVILTKTQYWIVVCSALIGGAGAGYAIRAWMTGP